MEKRSRVKKYKDLRDGMLDEAKLPRQNIAVEKTMEDDSVVPTLREYRLKQAIEESKEEVQDNILDEISNNIVDKEIEDALHRVRANVGKSEAYNTRADILNNISSKFTAPELKKPEIEKEVLASNTDDSVKFSEVIYDDKDDVVEIETEKEINKPISLQEKLAKTFSNIDDDTRDIVIEESEPKIEKSKQSVIINDDDEEEDGLAVKVLTVVLGILSVCLLGILIYFASIALF